MNTFPIGEDRSATKLHQVSLDGQIIDSLDITNAHHLFDIPSPDTFLWLSYDLEIRKNTEMCAGDLLIEAIEWR